MRRALARLAQLAARLAILAAGLPGTAYAIPQVVLVQNSGWMEPFYTDPKSAFKPLVTELVSSVVQPGDALVLAAFNQSLPGAPSPRGLLSEQVDAGTAHGHVQAALRGLEMAHKPGGRRWPTPTWARP